MKVIASRLIPALANTSAGINSLLFLFAAGRTFRALPAAFYFFGRYDVEATFLPLKGREDVRTQTGARAARTAFPFLRTAYAA